MIKTTAITSSTWAIQDASPATPLAPNASAIKAIIKKMIAYLSMGTEPNPLDAEQKVEMIIIYRVG
jgi:hypothetical protein